MALCNSHVQKQKRSPVGRFSFNEEIAATPRSEPAGKSRRLLGIFGGTAVRIVRRLTVLRHASGGKDARPLSAFAVPAVQLTVQYERN